MHDSSLKFNDLSFDPEAFPYGGRTSQDGRIEFKNIDGWTLLAIAGSPSDSRPACKSVFFIHEVLTRDEMITRIKSIQIANKILTKIEVRVKINWDS